jgi:cell division protein FtsW (lipid II flippase)
MTPLFRKFLSMNWILVVNMYALIAFGIVAIYAAGWAKEEPALVTAWSRQIIWVVIGTVVFFGTSLIDYQWVKWGGVPIYVAEHVLEEAQSEL